VRYDVAGVVCTHGDDAPPPGVDTSTLPSVAELVEARYGVDDPALAPAEVQDDPAVAATTTVACIGDGTSGARVQLVYARASDVPDRYNAVLPLLRQYASDVDDVINVSAGRVGDGRRVRYVTNSSCQPHVAKVTLSASGDDNFGAMVSELRELGYKSPDRKYLVFMDAAVGICGLGEVYLNDNGADTNPNNAGVAMYSRVDTSCWQYAAAHELLHTLGAVQNSAPNSTQAGHCTDEIDVMCYRDTKTTVTRQVCNRAGQVDCNYDDYFHPNPKANSYLATKWNTARSRYLESAAPPPPPKTTASIPAAATAGVATAVRVDLASAGAVAWTSTRSECWFADPSAARTEWTCPASAEGQAEVTAQVTEAGVTTPFSQIVSLVRPVTKMPTGVTMTASATRVVTGRQVQFSGRVRSLATSASIAGIGVSLDVRPKGSRVWRSLAEGQTNRSGFVSFDVRVDSNAAYRFRSLPNPTWAMGLGDAKAVAVLSKLSTSATKRAVTAARTGRTVTVHRITGKVSPDKAGKRIRLQRRIDGQWRTIRSKTLNQHSRYVFRFAPKKSGTFRLRVVKPGDRRHVRTERPLRVTS